MSRNILLAAALELDVQIFALAFVNLNSLVNIKTILFEYLACWRSQGVVQFNEFNILLLMKLSLQLSTFQFISAEQEVCCEVKMLPILCCKSN